MKTTTRWCSGVIVKITITSNSACGGSHSRMSSCMSRIRGPGSRTCSCYWLMKTRSACCARSPGTRCALSRACHSCRESAIAATMRQHSSRRPSSLNISTRCGRVISLNTSWVPAARWWLRLGARSWLILLSRSIVRSLRWFVALFF